MTEQLARILAGCTCDERGSAGCPIHDPTDSPQATAAAEMGNYARSVRNAGTRAYVLAHAEYLLGLNAEPDPAAFGCGEATAAVPRRRLAEIQQAHAQIPAAVVVDWRDGSTWAKTGTGQPFTKETAQAFATQRNSECKPGHRTHRVFTLTPAVTTTATDHADTGSKWLPTRIGARGRRICGNCGWPQLAAHCADHKPACCLLPPNGDASASHQAGAITTTEGR